MFYSVVIMSEKIIKFKVTPRAKKAFNVILILSVILGIASLVGGIVVSTWKPQPTTQTYYLDDGEELVIRLDVEEGQLIYFAVETDDDPSVYLIEYDDYLDGGGFYVEEEINDDWGTKEATFKATKTTSYAIWVKNYDPYDYAYGVISYSVYNSNNALKLVLYLGTVLFPTVGMISALIIAMASDAKLKKAY